MKLGTIVVGTDFTETSEPAIAQALALAGHHGAELVIVHGSGLSEPMVPMYDDSLIAAPPWHGYVTERKRAAEEALDGLTARCREAGIGVSSRLSHSYADVAVVTAAREVHADLVVLGTHGRQGAERWLLGSVAASVLRLADRHVLVARPQTPPRARFERVMCGTDFSATSDRALDAAVALASPDANIEVIHCWEPPRFYGREAPEALIARMRGRAIEQGNQLCAHHAGGSRHLRFELVDGRPASGILEAIEEHEGEILVVGSHGRRGVRRLILGSVAEELVRSAPISVLIARGEPARCSSGPRT